MTTGGSPDGPAILLSLARLTSLWSSHDYQRRVSVAAGVSLDPATVRAVYLLGLADGPIRPSELAGALHLSRPSTSKLLGRLEAAGLVDRVPDPLDRRSLGVTLGADGQRAFSQLFGAGIDMVASATAYWDPEDVDRLNDLLPRFVAGLLAAPAAPHRKETL
ncbi:MarR family transcriptional regulator [Leucobacter sp. CSA2]|uniref:MarR family transcriptional regulator n=1 Tax=Leucobacter edaphi TaxID=2796472 RepID=A0A934UWK6_9MICO|nr:MarR family transcriptional regulator [Leucobacter edaphi]MBK0420636.1 MarR family transcriptional regulator [Leucobacter edaphi]